LHRIVFEQPARNAVFQGAVLDPLPGVSSAKEDFDLVECAESDPVSADAAQAAIPFNGFENKDELW